MSAVHRGAAVVALWFAVGPVAAQTTVALQPFVGYYRPLGSFDPAAYYSTDLPQQPTDLSGFAVGGAVRVAFQGHIALEGLGVTATSTIPGCLCPGGPRPPTQARVTIVAVQGQYAVLHADDRYGLWLGAGPAIVVHGGEAYGRYGSPTSWGGLLGLDLAIRLSSYVQAVGSARGVGYTFNLDAPPQHGKQFDAILSLGLQLHSGH